MTLKPFLQMNSSASNGPVQVRMVFCRSNHAVIAWELNSEQKYFRQYSVITNKSKAVKNFSLFAALLFPLAVGAQKIDLDRFFFAVQFRSLPKMHLDSTYRTYNVEVETTQLMNSFLNELSPANSVLLEGWRKLEKNGHITIKVKIGDLVPESFSIKEQTENIKNKNGQTTIKSTYYQEVNYTFDATASITDYKGMHIMDQELASRSYKQVYTSPGFPLRQMAKGYFLLNSMSLTKELYRKSVNNAMHYLSDRLTENFGFSEVSVRDHMWIIDSRKDPEYAAHRQAFRQMNDALFSMNASTPIENVREQLKPVINYFEKIKTEYGSNSKHDRKIRYASYFNLAVLYYYLDDPQSMMKEANGLVLNDFDTRDGKNLEQTASWLKNLFEESNIYTRHFPINTTNFKGPKQRSF